MYVIFIVHVYARRPSSVIRVCNVVPAQSGDMDTRCSREALLFL